jgi:hypothetical protein
MEAKPKNLDVSAVLGQQLAMSATELRISVG